MRVVIRNVDDEDAMALVANLYFYLSPDEGVQKCR
jgi:hypothetical protein